MQEEQEQEETFTPSYEMEEDNVIIEENVENDLFKSLQSEYVTQEQFHHWKLLHRQAGNLVESDNDVLDDLFMDVTEQLEAKPSTSVLAAHSSDDSAEMLDSEDIRHTHARLIDLDSDVTMKYLKGEISFQQFSDVMDKVDQCLSQQSKGKNKQTNVKRGKRRTTLRGKAGPDIEDIEEEDGGRSHLEADTEDDESQSQTEEDRDKDWIPARSVEEKRRTKRPRRRQTDLPKHLQGLMGEANLKFARGDSEEAMKICMEVVRLAPLAVEPFQTLGMLYEELGDMQKSLQFYLIAAHLRPEDPEEWSRLAELSKELGETKQSVTCYTKALKFDPHNLDYALERCNLFEELGEHKKVLESYQQLLRILPKDSGPQYMQLARSMTKVYHESKDTSKALEVMRHTFDDHPNLITSEDVNLLLELQMNQKLYVLSIEVLVNHCGVELYFEDGTQFEIPNTPNNNEKYIEDNAPKVKRCVVSDLLPIDLRIKLAVCLIHSLCLLPLKSLLGPLFEQSPESNGDLYLDVAEAYVETGQYKEAKPLLELLVHTDNYSLAAVWLRYGECLNALGELEPAGCAYQRVIELAPAHLSARFSLSAIQQQLGDVEGALHTLTIDSEGELSSSEQRLMVHRCFLLYSYGRSEEFVQNSQRVLFSHIKEEYRPIFRRVILNYKGIRNRNEALRSLIPADSETGNMFKSANSGALSTDELWDLYMKLCQTLINEKRMQELQETTFLALTRPQFATDSEKVRECEFLCLVSCVLNKNGQSAYKFIKDICVRELDNTQAWNLFGQIITYSQDLRHNRFCLRLMVKHPDHVALGLLNGHNSMLAGSYKHALGEYVSAFRQAPNDPLISLCIGLVFIHMGSQKFAAKRHSLITQGCAFLNMYMELRGECQETHYNMGRAMHQLNLLYVAVYYYKKALTFEPIVDDPEQSFDLRREIAYNLALIYQSSGSKDLARMIIQKYCVI